jgi:hypothetical protein
MHRVAVETTIRLSGGPLANRTVNTGAVTVGSLVRLTRPSGAPAYYRVTSVEQVPERNTFIARARFEPKGDRG